MQSCGPPGIDFETSGLKCFSHFNNIFKSAVKFDKAS